jgi:hypothetical protein
MRFRLIASPRKVDVLIVAGALILDLGSSHRLHAQVPGVVIDRMPGRSATADPTSRLRAQHLATHKAGVRYDLARSIRELAEIAERVYVELTIPRERAAIDEEIRLAESDLARAKHDLERARRRDRFFPTPQVSGELTFKKGEFTLEQAQSKRKVLVEYIGPKTIEEFKSVLEKVRSNERVRKQDWEREKAKEAELLRQLDVI